MEFEDQDDETRVQYEGFRPGMYVRIEIDNVPCEFVLNFDPHYPVILGGLGNSEGNVGYVQVCNQSHKCCLYWYKYVSQCLELTFIFCLLNTSTERNFHLCPLKRSFAFAVNSVLAFYRLKWVIGRS